MSLQDGYLVSYACLIISNPYGEIVVRSLHYLLNVCFYHDAYAVPRENVESDEDVDDTS